VGRSTAVLLFATTLLFAGACGTSEATEDAAVSVRACGLTIWHKPASGEAHVEVVGDWDGWKRPGKIPEARSDGWRVAALDVPPGEHAYAIVEDGVWLTDKNQPMTGTHQGKEVSVGTAFDCAKPQIRVERVATTPDGTATVELRFLSSSSRSPIDPDSLVVTGRHGEALRVAEVDPAEGTVKLVTTGLKRGKYTFTIQAKDRNRIDAEDARATVWIDARSGGKLAWDPRDAIVYQVMLDRFRNAEGPLAPPAKPSARAGGTLEGVRLALESGEIEALGATAIWLSPLYKNPVGEFRGNDGNGYTSYHGYWPIDSRALDERFATETELEAFVAAAHARGIRVLFDVVPNHVHEQHPYAKQHPDWFVQDCLCGQGSCDWGAHIKTCWFAPYLPDLDWQKPEPQRAATEDVLWWLDRWDADGIRIDAVPMMPRSATRRIANAVRSRYEHPGNALYILGENFTGPGGYQSLRYDLGPYGLDGSFHFPLMWTLREAIAAERKPLSDIEASFRTGEQAWEGANAVMGLMIGNHDVSRFASVSAGNADGNTWESPPQPLDPTVYAKQRLALATVFTFPGAPVLYYGDEVGLAGRSDPDCRRVMPAEDALLPEQVATRELTRKLGRARSCSVALRRGTKTTLLAEDERLVFVREHEGEAAIVSLSRRPSRPVTITLPKDAPSTLVDVATGQRVDASAGLPIDSEAFAVHVFLPADSACAR